MYHPLLRGRDVVFFFAIDRLSAEVIAVCCSAKAAYRQVGGKRLVYTELRTGPSHNCMHLNHHFVCLGHVCSPGRSVSWEEVTWGVINSGWASLLVVMRGYCGGSAS